MLTIRGPIRYSQKPPDIPQTETPNKDIERLVAKRNELFAQIKVIEGHINGIDLAISLIDDR